jgi:hypothetical protein
MGDAKDVPLQCNEVSLRASGWMETGSDHFGDHFIFAGKKKKKL